MKYIIDCLLKVKGKLLPSKVTMPIGRWKIEYCNKIINNKIDLSNEDHCGPCGQYAKSKTDLQNKTIADNKNLKK